MHASVLVVENNPYIIRALLAIAEEECLALTIAKTEDANLVTDKMINGADKLISDTDLEGTSGIDLVRRAKKLKPKMPVLLLVGRNCPIPKGHRANKVLKKPVEVRDIIDWIQEPVK